MTCKLQLMINARGGRKVLLSNQVSILQNVLSLYTYRGKCPTNDGDVFMHMVLSFWLGKYCSLRLVSTLKKIINYFFSKI